VAGGAAAAVVLSTAASTSLAAVSPISTAKWGRADGFDEAVLNAEADPTSVMAARAENFMVMG